MAADTIVRTPTEAARDLLDVVRRALDAVTAIEAAAHDLIRSVESVLEHGDLPVSHGSAIIDGAQEFTGEAHVGISPSCWHEEGLAEAARDLVDLVERITAGTGEGGGA